MTPRPGAHERVYGALLRLYPSAFRDRFAGDMTQLFGDRLRDARHGRRSGSVVAMWLRTFGDLAVTASAEHARRNGTVANSLAVAPSVSARLLGILGILGGLLLVVVFVIEIGPELNLLRLVMFNVGAIAIVVAVSRRQVTVARRLTLAAAVPAILTNAWYLGMLILSIGRPVYPEPDPEFRPIFFYAAIALWLTDTMFGAVALRIGVVSRWAALSLTIGSLLAFGGIGGLGLAAGPYGAIVERLSLIGIALNGIGWIALGFDVATRRRPAHTRQVNR